MKKQELPSSHARAYAHTNRRLRIFAVTSVTLYLQTTHNQHNTDYTQVYFNNSVIKPLKRGDFGNAKHIVTTSFFVYFSSFFRYHFTTNVTLVTAKKLNRCWKARAQHARVRLREKNFSFHTLSAPRTPTICCTAFLTTPRTLPQTIHRNACSSRKKSIDRHVTIFFHREFPRFNPNRSLDPEQISLDC